MSRPKKSLLSLLLRSVFAPTVIRVFRSERTRRLAIRLVQLSAFDAWCKVHPCPLVADRFRLYGLVFESEQLNRPIDYLEFGVFRGATLRWWSERNTQPESRFVGFDSFEGLPEDWRPGYPKGAFDARGKTPDIADDRVSYQVGLFQATLPPFLRRFERTRRTVLHIDADLFSSTLFVLIHLVPQLAPGDIVLFDEFGSYVNEFRAWEELLLAYPCSFEALGATAGFGGRGYGRLAVKLVSVQQSFG